MTRGLSWGFWDSNGQELRSNRTLFTIWTSGCSLQGWLYRPSHSVLEISMVRLRWEAGKHGRRLFVQGCCMEERSKTSRIVSRDRGVKVVANEQEGLLFSENLFECPIFGEVSIFWRCSQEVRLPGRIAMPLTHSLCPREQWCISQPNLRSPRLAAGCDAPAFASNFAPVSKFSTVRSTIK
jgi:hypothetical protein